MKQMREFFLSTVEKVFKEVIITLKEYQYVLC